MKPKDYLDILKQTVSEWGQDKASQLAAALAYYTVFSLAPLLIIVITIVGLVVGKSSAQDQIMSQIKGLVGDSGASLLQTMIENANKPSSGIIATVLGVITLALGAAGVFGQLKGTLNQIWGVEVKGEGGLKGILANLKSQFLSFTMVLGVGFLLLVSLVLSAALSAASQFISGAVPLTAGIGELLNFVISFIVITVMFAAIYKVLPDVKIDWRDVWIGAAVTALLFTIGKFAIGLYLGRSSPASAYGAAGSLVVLLLWIYYSAQILFFGAEFTQVYAVRRAGKPLPAKSPAVYIEDRQKVEPPQEQATAPKPEAAKPAKPAVRQDRVVTTADRVHSVGQVALVLLTIFTQIRRLRGGSSDRRSRETGS